MTPLPAARLTGSLCVHAKPSSEVLTLGFAVMIQPSVSLVRKECHVAGGSAVDQGKIQVSKRHLNTKYLKISCT